MTDEKLRAMQAQEQSKGGDSTEHGNRHQDRLSSVSAVAGDAHPHKHAPAADPTVTGTLVYEELPINDPPSPPGDALLKEADDYLGASDMATKGYTLDLVSRLRDRIAADAEPCYGGDYPSVCPHAPCTDCHSWLKWSLAAAEAKIAADAEKAKQDHDCIINLGVLHGQEMSCRATAEAERDDAVKRMEQGWIQVCAEPAIKQFQEQAEAAEALARQLTESSLAASSRADAAEARVAKLEATLAESCRADRKERYDDGLGGCPELRAAEARAQRAEDALREIKEKGGNGWNGTHCANVAHAALAQPEPERKDG